MQVRYESQLGATTTHAHATDRNAGNARHTCKRQRAGDATQRASTESDHGGVGKHWVVVWSRFWLGVSTEMVQICVAEGMAVSSGPAMSWSESAETQVSW